MTDIRALAKDCGFDRCYVLRMQRFSHYARRLSEASLHVGGRNLVEDPAGAYPWANALLFLIRAYAPLPPEALLSGYYLASNEAYQAANRLIAELEAQGVRSQRCNVPVRECAVANGLGAPLKNGLTAFLGPGEPIGSRAAVQTLAVCLPEPVEYANASCRDSGRASVRGVEGVGGVDGANGIDAGLAEYGDAGCRDSGRAYGFGAEDWNGIGCLDEIDIGPAEYGGAGCRDTGQMLARGTGGMGGTAKTDAEPVSYENTDRQDARPVRACGASGMGEIIARADMGLDRQVGGLADRRKAWPEFAAVCRDCRACEHACPVGAIGPDGFRFERCIRSYLSGGEMPGWVMDAMGSLLGCELCQRACPANAAVRPVERALPEFELSRLLSGDVKPALMLVGKNENSGGRLIAQAAVLTARQGRRDLLTLIEALASDARPLVRQAAQYAIKRLASKA